MSVWVRDNVTRPWEVHDCGHCRWWEQTLPCSGKCRSEYSERWGDLTWSDELCEEWERDNDDED